MSQFLECIEDAIKQRHLLAPGQKVLVAVSGGVDSVVLLHALHHLSTQNGWELVVAHFNHGLRGRASNADESLVRKAAKKHGLKFISEGANVRQLSASSKISVEMAARKLRHEFLARVARQHGIRTVALAHHADDQVELFFLRVLRGAGSEGLAGMKWRSPSPAEREITLVRPLLGLTKAELLSFARNESIPFREDATNFENDFLRNRIRNELLPLLRKKYQPGLDRVILRLMENLGAESEFISAAASEFCGRAFSSGKNALKRRGQKVVRPLPFDSLAVAVQRKALQQQLTRMGLMPDFELIEQLRKSAGNPLMICTGLTVLRDKTGKIHFQEIVPNQFQSGTVPVDLSARSGTVNFNDRTFQWRFQRANGLAMPSHKSRHAASEQFDANKVGDKIILRHWLPGDRFQPIGMKAAVKLQDLFVNAKIPAARRRNLVLACTVGGEIFWVESLRIGENFKLTPQTRRKLQWQMIRPS